jgi:hypothetical protein
MLYNEPLFLGPENGVSIAETSINYVEVVGVVRSSAEAWVVAHNLYWCVHWPLLHLAGLRYSAQFSSDGVPRNAGFVGYTIGTLIIWRRYRTSSAGQVCLVGSVAK